MSPLHLFPLLNTSKGISQPPSSILNYKFVILNKNIFTVQKLLNKTFYKKKLTKLVHYSSPISSYSSSSQPSSMRRKNYIGHFSLLSPFLSPPLLFKYTPPTGSLLPQSWSNHLPPVFCCQSTPLSSLPPVL